VAVSCTDLEGLVSWYTRNLGFQIIGKIRHFSRQHTPEAFTTIFTSYPPSMRELKFAMLTSGNGVGLEVFQFIDPPPVVRTVDADSGFEFARVGFFHICVTDPNPEALLRAVVNDGGRQIGEWMDYGRYGLTGHRGVYMQDPWGNGVEVMSISVERVCSAGGALAWMQQQQQQQQQQDR
jgi:catechol 2,3-dioxygenase-like lactoylglutathione lyase family enzyme